MEVQFTQKLNLVPRSVGLGLAEAASNDIAEFLRSFAGKLHQNTQSCPSACGPLGVQCDRIAQFIPQMDKDSVKSFCIQMLAAIAKTEVE